jgi:hypothetical protein
MSSPKMKPHANTVIPTLLTVHLCVPDDQVRHLPKRRKAPESLPPNVPVPRQGDVIYLSRSSAWGVEVVVYDWLAPDQLRIEIWLKHVGSAQQLRESGFVPLLQ